MLKLSRFLRYIFCHILNNKGALWIYSMRIPI